MSRSTALTVFTPTYNRAHTLVRTYDSLCRQSCSDFCWLVIDDGSTDSTRMLVKSWIEDSKIDIHYVYKPNGGLYTAYNTAYELITTELSMCVDSDDFLADDAVAIVLEHWRKYGSDKYAGMIGLDYNLSTSSPIGGLFTDGLRQCFYLDLSTKGVHRGDSKLVMRTDLMREVAPMLGYAGEKYFNPVYLTLKVCDIRPLLIINRCLCWVEYQPDSMSRSIFAQYIDSPRSFCKLHWMELKLRRNTLGNRLRCICHILAFPVFLAINRVKRAINS